MPFAPMSKVNASAAIPDEEQFRLITGFNDIFVSIAAAILLFAVGWIGQWIGQHRACSYRQWRNGPASLPRWRLPRHPGVWRLFFTAAGGWRCPRSCFCCVCRRRVADGRFRSCRSSVRTPRHNPTAARLRRRRGGAIAAAARPGALAPLPRPGHDRRRRRRVVGRLPSACPRRARQPQDARGENLILGFVLPLGIGVFLFAMWWEAPTAASRAARTSPSGCTCWQRR